MGPREPRSSVPTLEDEAAIVAIGRTIRFVFVRLVESAGKREAAFERFHQDSHEQFRARRQLFVDADNHARRLKALRGLTPAEFNHQICTKESERRRLGPVTPRPGAIH